MLDNTADSQSDDAELGGCEFPFTRLTSLVRQQYTNYLGKQLEANVLAWRRRRARGSKRKHNQTELPAHFEGYIEESVKVLEASALRACMMAQVYQRSMVKIIAGVRRSTQECRLEDHLQQVVADGRSSRSPPGRPVGRYKNTGTQTEHAKHVAAEAVGDGGDDFTSLSLKEKISMFQQRLDTAANSSAAMPTGSAKAAAQYQVGVTEEHYRLHRVVTRNHAGVMVACEDTVQSQLSPLLSSHYSPLYSPPTNSPTHPPRPLVTPAVTPAAHEVAANPTEGRRETPLAGEGDAHDDADDDDEIAKGMAEIFREEQTEFDLVLGLQANSDPDDPQLRDILKEIQGAKQRPEAPTTAPGAEIMAGATEMEETHTPQAETDSTPTDHPDHKATPRTVESLSHQRYRSSLRHSLWPCELYMQRSRLSSSLARLVDEDLRWHEVMQWKFAVLFDSDSDDDAATYSPSIELDEVVLSSSVRRISPWMVKHLMDPLKHGLIANRYLFKQLGKLLARWIIMQKQYPDEKDIKNAVDYYFCVHGAITTIHDLADLTNL